MIIVRVLMVMVAAIFTATMAFAESNTAPSSAPTSLSETYEDWTLACSTRSDKRICSTFQRQARKGGQMVLAIELTPGANKSVTGTLILPFGLDLDKGVAFAVDDTAPGKPSRFATCLPVGCLVSLSFTDKAAAALRSGKAFKITVHAYEGGPEIPLSVSLKGLGNALDRIATLSN